MIPLTKLKKDVQFNAELTKGIDVMKGIAAARFHVLERQLTLFEPYFKATAAFMTMPEMRHVRHPFTQVFTPAVGVLMITSNEGFLGGLNNQVISQGLREGGPEGVYVVVGERGVNYIRDARRAFTTFPGIVDHDRLSLAVAVRDQLVRHVLAGQCGRVVVVYPKPISFSVQQVTIEPLLPCAAWEASVPPAAGPMIWESGPEDVVEYVVGEWISYRLEQLFALSRLAELAARAIHLEGSYQELLRIGKKLRVEYFRARHEVIDRSMREIFAAQLLSRHRSRPAAEAEPLAGSDEEELANA